MGRDLYNLQVIDKYKGKIWLTPEEAIELFSAWIELKPTDYRQYQYRADAKFKLGDFAGALDDLNIALSLDGTEHEGNLIQRAISLSRLKQYEEALAILNGIDEVICDVLGYIEIEDFHIEVDFLKEQLKDNTSKKYFF